MNFEYNNIKDKLRITETDRSHTATKKVLHKIYWKVPVPAESFFQKSCRSHSTWCFPPGWTTAFKMAWIVTL